MRKPTFVIVAALASLALAGPALSATTADRADPAEKVNRFGFGIHQTLDRYLLRPAAMAFQAITPKPVRHAIENILRNLGEPLVAGNDLLQGRFHKAGVSGMRFVVNSTVGVGGIFDVGQNTGLPHHDNGFALTLGRAGVKSGPYLFIPLVGPTTVRDAIGSSVDAAADPFQWVVGHRTKWIVSEAVVGGLDKRANADADLTALMADATDPYATLRSVYLQNKQSQVDDANPNATPALPDFDEGGVAPATAPASPPARPATPVSDSSVPLSAG